MFVDDTGIGRGVLDRLVQPAARALGINFGDRPERTDVSKAVVRYVSKRTELPAQQPDCRDLATSNTATTALMLLCERNDDVCRRGLTSLDGGDARPSLRPRY